jgi:hypothetical protein
MTPEVDRNQPASRSRPSESLRWVITMLAAGCGMAVPLLHNRTGEVFGPGRSYAVGTVALLVLAAISIASWPLLPTIRAQQPLSRRSLGLFGVWTTVTALFMYSIASSLLPVVFAGPVDPNRGDMLVVIEAGVRQFLQGKMPYSIYHVPWEAALPYGPTLWMPFSLPVIARTDLRLLTLIIYLCVVATCLLAAAANAYGGRWLPAVTLTVLGVFLGVHPEIHTFYPIGHTYVYWPLLLILCVLLHLNRWTGAAVTLGLLVSARTTMLSIVPIFVIAAYYRGQLSRTSILWLVLAAVGPFLPFLIVDSRSVYYALYGSYLTLMRGFVWTHTTWVLNTFGITGLLLARDMSAYIGIVQAACLLLVYGFAWRALRRGASPEPWFAFALLIFSMTAVWPVLYLYFDVWVLVISALIARTSVPSVTSLKSLAALACVLLVLTLAAVIAAGSVQAGALNPIDVGTPAASGLTGGGFGRDETSIDEGRTFVWVEGESARIRMPRAAWGGATIHIDIRPYELTGGFGQRQRVAASLNANTIGVVALEPHWQRISFHAPALVWNYGFNILTLNFSYASLERQSGRRLSVGIDRVSVD